MPATSVLKIKNETNLEAMRQSMVVGFTFADVLDSFDTKVVVLDAAGQIVYANRAWYGDFWDQQTALTWGVGADYLAVCDRAAAQGDSISAQMAKALRDVLDGRSSGFEQDYPSPLPRLKKWFTLRVSAFASNGHRFAVLQHRDISRQVTAEKALERREQELQKMNARLQNLARTDALTGVLNRRGFMESLDRELTRSVRFASPLSLIMMDVDHFKKYNDSFGHPSGDLVLAQIGEILREEVREVDTAARYGGEEFVLLLPETDLDGAAALGERVRSAVESCCWPHRPITVSVGVAALPEGKGDAALLLRFADEALYHSKAEGRNRVSCFDLRQSLIQSTAEHPEKEASEVPV